MMKAILLSGLSAIALAAAVVEVQATSAASPEFNSLSYPHLAELNQSQIFETLSMADGLSRLPASTYQTAGVYFITNSKGQIFDAGGKNNNFDDPTGKYCSQLGFKVTSCASGLFNKSCPYNEKIYDKCCDATYKYTKSQCAAPKKLSSDTCGGKYKCYCDTGTYPYASCNSPKIKGSSCADDSGTRYSSCSCPTGVATPYGCETYYASPCNSVCKTAYKDNCRNRTAVQIPYGCERYFADCSSKCEKAYPDNCRNRNAVSAPYGCQKYYADCQSKCETAYPDNCRNRTAVSTPYGCQKYYTDCSSKCEKAYPDNCRNRNAVSAPYGCKKYYTDCSSKCETAYPDNCHNRTAAISSCPTNASCSYFSDCSSRIQSWSCKTGYIKSGSVCKLNQAPLPILYGDGTVTKEILSNKTPIGVVFDETNKLAVALTDVKEDGSAGSEYLTWSGSSLCDVPGLENCSGVDILSGYIDLTPITCGVDGRANTDLILAYGSNCGGTPAATACNKYEPTGCTKDFCKKTKWFFPSLRDLQNMYITKDSLDTTLTLLSSNGATIINAQYLRSSTECTGTQAWVLVWDVGYKQVHSKYKYGDRVRPVVKY